MFWTRFWIFVRKTSALVALLLLAVWATWTTAWRPEVIDFGLAFTSLGWTVLALVVTIVLIGLAIFCIVRATSWTVIGGMAITVVAILLIIFVTPTLIASIDLSKVLSLTLLLLTGIVLFWLSLDPYPILNRKKRRAMKLALYENSSDTLTATATTYHKVPATDPTTTPDFDDPSAAPAADPSA